MKNRFIYIAIFLGLFTLIGWRILTEKREAERNNSPDIVQDGEIYYPISRYTDRLTFRTFGQKVTADDKPECGFPFFGVHNADDLEIFPYESNTVVPIIAASRGKVVFKNYVDGYGGLIIISSNVDNQDVLINYGHINISTAKVKIGEEVTAGQEIAYLGDGCSSETDGERKHLHFAIHKGRTLDLKGYLQSESELQNWLNPRETLERLGAKTK